MLAVEGITVRFGGVVAVDQVSMRLGDGEILGLAGPNGSGKSTFLNAIGGFVGATGAADLDGRPLPFGRPRRVRERGVLRTFQTPQVFGELSCLDNAVLSSPDTRLAGLPSAWFRRRAMISHERIRWEAGHAALDRVGLGAMAGARAGELAYGQQRLLELARVLVAQPRVVLADEPAAGLNSAETDRLAQLLLGLQAEGVALLVVDHKIDFLDQICDRVVVLQTGRVIAAGPSAQVWRDPQVVEAYLGQRAARGEARPSRGGGQAGGGEGGEST